MILWLNKSSLFGNFFLDMGYTLWMLLATRVPSDAPAYRTAKIFCACKNTSLPRPRGLQNKAPNRELMNIG
jgi:hypothetical protein